MEDYSVITIEGHFNEEYKDEGVSDARVFASYDASIMDSLVESISATVKTDTTYEKLVFGQVIIIENILASSMPQYKRISSILATFYRPSEENVFNNTESAVEAKQIALFETIPAGLALKLFDNVISMRKTFFYQKYADVVYRSVNSQVQGESSEQPTYEEKFYKVFGWYERQRSIAKELNMKMSDVLMMNSCEAMTELSYQSHKAKIEEMRIERSNANRKSKKR